MHLIPNRFRPENIIAPPIQPGTFATRCCPVPLWGIEKMDKEDQHARFENYRDMSEQTRNAFKAMLLGSHYPKYH